MELTAVRGMHDLAGDEMRRWHFVEKKIREIFAAFGYAEIRTPVLEKVEVFKAVGDSTDIVEKQMYTVEDRGGHRDSTPETLVMRPEGTAGFVRAVVEHQLHSTGHPQRFYYYLPMYRYERPQKGRLRQFHQFGAEVINDPSPEVDAELLILLDHIYKSFGLTQYEIRINSVGSAESRPAYKEKLQAYFRPHLETLCEQCKTRFERNPLRILDCKNETCQKLAKDAPLLLNHLSEADRAHHETVKKRLADAGVSYIEDPFIVRGLDYYCKTAFEFSSPLLGAQSALGGGGRYDGLATRFGKANFPAVGWALGMERLMIALEAINAFPESDFAYRPQYFFAPLGDRAFDEMYPIALSAKRSGVAVEMSYDRSKGLKWLMKQADRVGARKAIILGENELAKGIVVVKEMGTGQQTELSRAAFEDQMKGKA